MESVQTYLPTIEAMLSEWYLFTLNNALYAAALAVTVWLLTAIIYSIRIASIKRSKAANEKAAAQNFDAMQQQLQLNQEELASTAEQMEKAQAAAEDESKRALALEQLIYQRNQHIAGTIQTLATSFDLGERPLLASEDVKSDSLWQQHDKVIMQLIERLRTEQQAKTELQQTCQSATIQLAEKESLLNALQSTLANHTNLLAKLEQALEEQKSMLQQQHTSQQALSDTLKNFQAAPVVAPSPVEFKVEPTPETFRAVDWQQPLQAASPIPEDTQAAQSAPVTHPAPVAQAEQINEQPQATVSQPIEEAPVETPVESVRAIETEMPSELVRAIEEEELLDLVLDENLQPVPRKKPSAPSATEQATAPAKGSFGKIKGLFGKKPQPEPDAKPQPVVAEEEASSVSPEPEQQPVAPAKESVGKIKNLFGKKQPPVKTEPQWTDTQPDERLPSSEEQPNTDQQPDDLKAPGKLKGFYSKFRSKDK